MGVNKQVIIGNLGKDPDCRTFQDGSKACRFSVAVTEKSYTLQNGTQVPEHTEWFNILCRGKKAEIAEQYLHKGDKVYIEGATFTGEYQDQNGQKIRYTEVRCEVLELLTPKPQAQAQQGYAPGQAAPQFAPGAQPAPQTQFTPTPQPVQQTVGVYGVPVGDKPW